MINGIYIKIVPTIIISELISKVNLCIYEN